MESAAEVVAGRAGAPVTEAQVERFLELVREGLTRQEAARRVQGEWDADESLGPCWSTSSRWKGRAVRDPVFRQRYMAALEGSGQDAEGAEVRGQLDRLEKFRLLERAFDEYVERGLDPERGRSGASNRALLNLLTLMHRTFKPFLEARVRHVHTGNVGLFAQPVIDTSKLSLEEQDELIRLERRRLELIGKASPDDGGVGLLGAVGEEIVEGEFAELPALEAGDG